jgi:uncharacterized peroxidase-related enzyme
MTDGRERSKDGPWIRTVAESEATGLLAQHYAEARRRAGKIFNILRIQSLRPNLFVANIEVYKHVMFGPSGLTRAEREMAAVAVSVANHCHY